MANTSQSSLINRSQLNFVGRDQHNIAHNTTNIINNLNVFNITSETTLAGLRPVDRSGYYVPPCMRGTRQWIIDRIHTWLDDPETPNVLWLSGSPGAGKSTIASTLVSQLMEMGRLGSSFFFKRADVALSNPAAVWRTVAFDLAQTDTVIAEKLTDNLNARKIDPMRADIESHFKYLIEEPLMECWRRRKESSPEDRSNTGIDEEGPNEHKTEGIRNAPVPHRPVVVVVVLDALDECGFDNAQSTQRRIFMDTILKWSHLPSSFKLLTTSRDHLIPLSFRQVSLRIPIETGDLTSHESNIDIQNFLEQHFAKIACMSPSLQSWPGPSIIKQLTDRAAGLFIWAETVVRFLKQGFPETQLDLILNAFREGGDIIDQLYLQILQLSFPNSQVLYTLRRVVGAIVLAKTPLHRADLGHFLGSQERESSIDFILENLSSVISTRNSDNRIYISHLSFAEFMCDRRRCHESFVIDLTTQNQIMTLACLHIMKAGLRFNICNLESSYLRNDDLDLAPRIKRFISTHLLYACCFWAEHLSTTEFNLELRDVVQEFMEVRLLYWLEVLSLVKRYNIASRALLLIGEWIRVSESSLFGTSNLKL